MKSQDKRKPNSIKELAYSNLRSQGINPTIAAKMQGHRAPETEQYQTIRAHHFSPAKSDQCQPAQRSDLKVILDALPSQLESVQIVIGMLLSGAPSLLSAVLLEIDGIEWSNGHIHCINPKNGRTAHFGALPPLMHLLNARRTSLGPDAVHVIPELIFSQTELQRNPDCNRAHLNSNLQNVVRRAGARARQLIADFIISCGLKSTTVNYKSIRAHMISFWEALGIRRATLDCVTGGISGLHGLNHAPNEAEIERLREITWKYLEAIRNDQRFFMPTTHYDVCQAMMDELRNIQNEIAKLKSA